MSPGDFILGMVSSFITQFLYEKRWVFLRYLGYGRAKRVSERVLLKPATPVIRSRDPIKRVRFAAFVLGLMTVGGFSLSQTPELASDEMITQKVQETQGIITPRETTQIVYMTPHEPPGKDGVVAYMQPCACVDNFR